ncbi:FAD/NAD-binding domain-containing protein [Hymenopellis radicata]|nr:FAD/NAD-binding domain-containing protein [Hymenopellis radicata]
MSNTKFSVAICGGGIGGLVTAIALQHFSRDRKDIKIDIYEATPRFTDTGAGIVFWMRPFKILQKLGLGPDLIKLAGLTDIDFSPRKSFEYRKADQAKGLSFYEFSIPMGSMGFHRGQFLEILVAHLDPERVTTHFSKRLATYSQVEGSGSPIQMQFTDGTTATADVVIGSDGIRSTVRRIMLESLAAKLEATGLEKERALSSTLRNAIDPVWSGYVTYRGAVPRPKVEDAHPETRVLSGPVIYVGKDKALTAYPIAQGKLINVSAVVYRPGVKGTSYEGKTVEDRSQEELLQHYGGWEEEVQHLLRCVETPRCWVINVLNPLPLYTSGNIALLGDAAHGMTPGQGSGAGEAIEDAYILAALLSDPSTTLSTIPTALRAYESIRLPHANDVQQRSALSSDMACLNDPRFSKLVGDATEADMGKLWDLGFAIVENWKWAWTTDIDDDLEEALALKGRLHSHIE